ncbi:MAG: serine hydrolase domain-containing protein [Candidatus Tyrphobacter sp.]
MIEKALEYARGRDLHALLLWDDGAIVTEVYAGGYDAARAHALYSGTKSFWGVAAVVAQEEGLLHLDEPVAQTFPAWREDDRKARVTLRMLLQLTAGYGFGGLGASVPTYGAALAKPLRNEPETRFTYGGIALQAFGAVLAGKLAARGVTPVAFLNAAVLEPAGASVGSWRALADGTQTLPTGAALTARNWLAYGVWVLDNHARFAECFRGTAANSRYGLAWWLGAAGAPTDLFYASGSGGQGLYVCPSRRLIAVHFGESRSYKHDAFLRRLFA